MAITGATDLGNGKVAVTVDHDPTTTATNVPIGSLIIDASGNYYRKLDNGATTNVSSNIGTSGFSGFSGTGGSGSLDAQFSDTGDASTDATASDSATDTSLTNSFKNITQLTTPALTGTYWVEFYVEAGGDDPVETRLQQTSSPATTLCISNDESSGGPSTKRLPVSGFAEVVFSGSAKTFAVQCRAINASTCSARRGRIRIWKKT